jgi:hypothetical protein
MSRQMLGMKLTWGVIFLLLPSRKPVFFAVSCVLGSFMCRGDEKDEKNVINST